MKNPKKSISVKILEKLLEIAQSYTEPLSYQEADMLYNFLGLTGKIIRPHHYHQAIKRLEKRGLVKLQPGPKIKIFITRKGRKYLGDYKNKEMIIRQPKKWDGRWRLVIFDIPEKNKEQRNAFRSYLKHLGFSQVQQSVWAHPYPCQKEIGTLCELYNLTPYVSIFIGNHFGDDKELRKIYGL